MADKFEGGIVKGSTSVSVKFTLLKTADGTEQTGKAASDMTGSYLRQGGTRQAISLSDLGSVNASYSSGGVKELDATNMPGEYRLDLPNTAIETGSDGADWVLVTIKVASCFLARLWIPLTTYGTAALQSQGAGIKTKTDNLPSAIVKNVGNSVDFELRLISSPSTLATGLSPTVQISKDGGAFASTTNSASEIGIGVYTIALTATELNANRVALLFQGSGAIIWVKTIYTKAN
jgi:hypothetical protein